MSGMRARRVIVLSGIAAVCAATAARASVEISSAPTQNMQCSAGVCAPTAKKAVLNAGDLAAMLAASDVKVVTGSGAVTITVAASFSWTSASRLTLDAAQNVSFQAPVTVAGPGALTIVTNDGGSGGTLTFFKEGKLDFWDLTSSLVIGGSSYTLVSDLATLAGDVAATPAGDFALAADFDTGGATNAYRASPVLTPLDGVFDGLGHTISNLTIRERACDFVGEGLFSGIGQGGTVRDLHLDDIAISSNKPRYASGVAGLNSGKIANVWVSGAIKITPKSPHNCVDGAVAGGVVGASSASGSVVDAHSSASVSMPVSIDERTGAVAGGLAGEASNVGLSSATGDVNAPGAAFAGGLIGSGDHISRSFATGDAIATWDQQGDGSQAGGLVGASNNIANSYATGTGTGGTYAGGFAGVGSAVTDSYATGAAPAGGYDGGFFGYGLGTDTDDYWDMDTSQSAVGCGTGDCTGVTGLSDETLKSVLPAGFDKTVWHRNENINNGYPYLIDNPPQ